MITTEKIAAVAASLSPFEVECAITVALKIADDTCKMNETQKALFMMLYDAIPSAKTSLFDETVFELISIGRNDPTAFVFDEIGKLREMAMDVIGRPKMKAFKAAVRERIAA